MKKIQLSDGMPSGINRNVLNSDSVELLDEVKRICLKSGLSYVEINKALHLADEELYRKVINSTLKQS